MTYEDLLKEAEQENIYVMENAPFESGAEGLINGDVIGINKNIRSQRKRACILAEELGHYHTAVGDIIDQSSVTNQKLEQHGRIWAYNRLLGIDGLIKAHRHGCQSLSEAADYLNVTEDFLSEAFHYYKEKYGVCTTVGPYIIYFEPVFGVLEIRQ